MLIRRFTLIFAALWSTGIAGCTMCNDDRPTIDEKVGTYGKTLGEAKKELGESESLSEVHENVDELQQARKRFETSSQVQLALFATEIESRAADATMPIDRVEKLRRDYWNLVKMRTHVLNSTEQAFTDTLTQFESQVDTIREQLARVDRGQLP